jgi:hypothetical protein
MEDNSGTLTMELTDYMANLVKETFDLEIEMLQGTIEKLPDGRTKYVIEVGHEKSELVLKFILMTISKSNKLNYN